MLILLLILFFLSVLISFLMFLFVFLGLWGDFLGAPFVPTSNKYTSEILKRANLKNGQTFLELGSGDGRVVRSAVKNYQVEGIGIEIHPMLVFYSSFISKIQKLKNIHFIQKNYFKYDFKNADVIFTFLLPKTLKKLKEKILKECRIGTLIISHGFKIEGFDHFLVSKINRDIYPTYYYILKPKSL